MLMRKVGKRPDHADHLVVAQTGQQFVQLTAGSRVLGPAKRHRQPAHALDQFIGLAALVFAQGVAQQTAKQA